MMPLKPWHTVVTPREDLRAGRPLDASEFAVHLDHVRDGSAPAVYQDPAQFFERTFLTKSLSGLAVEVLRRLSGVRLETSAVFNMSTQFGGGKTHALTLLYHLALNGEEAARWTGVRTLLDAAGLAQAPKAAAAVFVGTEFDFIAGRGGYDGSPLRRTPWGEIAYQLGGPSALALLDQHEEQKTAPAGDMIRRFLPAGPCLILMDEVMNYVSQARASGLSAQFYNFVQNLSEVARSRDNLSLVVSIPASELEMNPEDHHDFERFKKLLDRVGKAVIVSAETETSEIIRRRLFEWDTTTLAQDGRVMLPKDAITTCRAYAHWAQDHREQLPQWFPVDHAEDAFKAAYPFHPALLSVFERKWQTLARFQQTRGILRLLALWISNSYAEGFKRAYKDALLTLGTAPLDDPVFRPAVFEQLGESRLEAAVTSDICGKADSHAVRLDAEAGEAIRKARLHRKIATTIFFESHGGGVRDDATLPEIRLAVGDPESDIGNIETALESLSDSCYYLSIERNRYRFSVSPNLNKLLADRRASITAAKIEDRAHAVIETEFPKTQGVEIIPFPERSSDIPDRPALTLIVLPPEYPNGDPATRGRIEQMTREYGTANRTFKSALIWCVPESADSLMEEARKLLAWEAIRDEERDHLDDTQKRQINENVPRAARDLKERVWQAYRHVMLLAKDNSLRDIDLGRVHSSAAANLVQLVLNRLRGDDELTESVSASFLVKNWPPAITEWSTKKLRSDFFASPRFPRLINGDALKSTIKAGVQDRMFAYVGKIPEGGYAPFYFGSAPTAIEISEDMFLITRETAEAFEKSQTIGPPNPPNPDPLIVIPPPDLTPDPPRPDGSETTTTGPNKSAEALQSSNGVRWSGEVPAQKWTTFYTKVLSRFAREDGIVLKLRAEFVVKGDVPLNRLGETRAALRELGLNDVLEPCEHEDA